MDETNQPPAGEQGTTASDRVNLSTVPCRRSTIETDEAFSGAT